MEGGMPLLTRPLYQHAEGADEDLWRLAFDTDTNRLFVEHEKRRGDMRGSGYATSTDEMDVAAFLGERGQGQQQKASSKASRSLRGVSGLCLRSGPVPSAYSAMSRSEIARSEI